MFLLRSLLDSSLTIFGFEIPWSMETALFWNLVAQVVLILFMIIVFAILIRRLNGRDAVITINDGRERDPIVINNTTEAPQVAPVVVAAPAEPAQPVRELVTVVEKSIDEFLEEPELVLVNEVVIEDEYPKEEETVPVEEETIEEEPAEEKAEEPVEEAPAEEAEEAEEIVEEVAEEPAETVATVEEEPVVINSVAAIEEVAEEEPAEEPVEEPVEEQEEPVEEVAEEPAPEEEPVEEVVEEVAEEVAEEPAVSAEPVEEEPVIEEPAPFEEESVEEMVVRYNHSFQSKLIRSNDNVKDFYTDIKNELLSYKKVRDRCSWKRETYRCGRNLVARLAFKGKTLVVYLPLDPEYYAGTKYKLQAVPETSSVHEETPSFYRISNPRRVRYARDLIAEVMARVGSVKVPREEVDYYMPYEGIVQLIEKGLVKRRIVKKSQANPFGSFANKSASEPQAAEQQANDATVTDAAAPENGGASASETAENK